MKIDQVFALGYLALGVFLGVLSNYLLSSNGNLTFALVIPLFVYLVSLFPLLKFIKSKKRRWIITNSFITFVLIWLVVWILLYNL